MARKRIILALAKGRIFNDTLELLKKSGISTDKINKKSRELIFKLDGLTILSCKPSDVPKYVELGAADCGIVGSDCISESQCDIYEPIGLNFGICKMIVAAKKGQKIEFKSGKEIKIATKYPKIASEYFKRKKMSPEIIYLNGSVELAPLIGLSDVIVDITETGETIRKNNLKIIDTVMNISAKFIVNKTSYRTLFKQIQSLSTSLKK